MLSSLPDFCAADAVNAPQRMRLGETLDRPRQARRRGSRARAPIAAGKRREARRAAGHARRLRAARRLRSARAAARACRCVDAAGYPEFPILEERISARFLREARALPRARGRARAGARDGRSDRRIHDRRVPDGDRTRGEAAGRDTVGARRGAGATLRRRSHGGRPDLRRRRAARRARVRRRRPAA